MAHIWSWFDGELFHNVMPVYCKIGNGEGLFLYFFKSFFKQFQPPAGFGGAAAEPVAERKFEALRFLRIGDFSPHFPTDAQRLQWLCDLAYCQFNAAELANGTAWEILAPNTMKAGLQDWAGLPPLENVIAFYEACRAFGAYPLRL